MALAGGGDDAVGGTAGDILGPVHKAEHTSEPIGSDRSDGNYVHGKEIKTLHQRWMDQPGYKRRTGAGQEDPDV